MATRYWVGASGGLWNSTANWSDTSGGSGGFSVPASGDTVIIDKSITTDSFINANVSLPASLTLTLSNLGATVAGWSISGTALATAGTTWSLTGSLSVDVPAGEYGTFNNSITGGGTITKTGAGYFGNIYTTSGSWGTSPIDVQGGGIWFAGANNKLGSGTVTLANGTQYAGDGSARSSQNPLVINGDVTLNSLNDFATVARGLLTLTGTVALGAASRTLTVGGSGAGATNSVTMSGVVSGTAGFTKAGGGTLTLSNTANTVSGEVPVNAGTLTISSTVLANATLVPGAGTISTSAGTVFGALSGSGNYAPNSTITVGSATANTTPNLSATYSGVLSGSNLITKAGTGTWTVDGANTNTGGFTINAGTFKARKGGATSGSLGDTTGTITIASGATLELDGNGTDQTFTKSGAALNVSGGTIKNSANNNTLIVSSGTLSTSAMLLDVTGGKLTLQCSGIIAGATIGITKTGSATLKLDTTTATFGGKVTLSAGTTEVTKLADSGTASSLGNGSGTPAIDVAATVTLSHVGTSNDSTNRVLNFTGGGTYTLDSSGVGGSVTYTGTPTFAATAANTIALTGTNTSTSNLLSGTINNKDGSNLTTITKAGAGTWGFGAGATLNFTGGLSISAGEFHCSQTAKTITAPISISGGTLSNGTAAITITGGSVTMTGGTCTAPLAGTGTLTINSGSAATLQPNAATGSNAQTGAITVSAGAVVRLVTPDAVDVSTAGNGRAIGNGDVTCAGTIRTATSSTSNQKGQARYKSLTLNSGARIEPGAA